MVEEPDPQVRAQRTQRGRNELHLVVLHPDGGALGGLGGGRGGKAVVDSYIRVPPVALVVRSDDDVMVERPQGPVGEALVVVRDLLLRQLERDQVHPPVVEGVTRLVRDSGPPHPGSLVLTHHRRKGGDEASR